MEKCGRAGELAAMLNGAGAETRIFSEVVPDPSIEVVAKAIQGMKEFEPMGSLLWEAVQPLIPPRQPVIFMAP